MPILQLNRTPQPQKKPGSRFTGIDLIKSLAILFVICVHFSLNTAYYTTPINDINMIVQTVIRWLFVSCVPLFLLSTGYLSAGKTTLKGHYIKLLRVIVPYIIISIACLAVSSVKGSEPFNLKKAIYSIFFFSADPYAWYVNMFIGLFLVAPFLNKLLDSLDKKAFHVLLLILTVLTQLPLTFNPILSYSDKFAYFFFPDFWSTVYPLTYYVAGVYIARFRPVLKTRWGIGIIALMVLIQTSVLLIAQPYLKNNWLLTDFGSIFIACQSTALFLLLYQTNMRGKLIQRLLSLISSATLEIYLFSYLADSSIYPYVLRLAGDISQQEFFTKYFIVVVPLVFLASLIPALILHNVYMKAEKVIRNYSRLRKPHESQIC